jgi:hypothetical protein
MLTTLRQLVSKLHYACTGLLAVLAIPAIQRLRLPMHADWRGMLLVYSTGLGTRSVLCALLFCVLAFPFSQTLGSVWESYRKKKVRLLLLLVFLIIVLSSARQFAVGIPLAIGGLFLVELAERDKVQGSSFHKRMISVLGSAAYLFVGIVLVLIYNDIIVASRFPLSHDSALNNVDMRIFFGRSVSDIAHTWFRVAPDATLRFLDFAYFQMFTVVGAAFLISAYGSSERGLQFAGSCLTAYYIALLIFYLWPTYGPYMYCPGHAARYPRYLTSYVFQKGGIADLQAISQRQAWSVANLYFIAFPSLHIALPVIAMWFLRRWRVVFWLLVVYSAVVACAVVLLEWHYALDIPGGIAVAALALAVVRAEPVQLPKEIP